MRALSQSAVQEFRKAFLSVGGDSTYAGALFDLVRPRFRHEAWIFEADGVPTARLIASVAGHDSSWGYIGLIEWKRGHGNTEDQLFQLLAAAQSWLKDQGVQTVAAPYDFSSWFKYRLMQNEDLVIRPKFSWEPESEPQLAKVLASAGFTPRERYASKGWFHSDQSRLFEVSRGGERCLARATRQNYRFETFLAPAFNSNLLQRVHALTEAAFAGTPHFDSIPLPLFEKVYVSGLQGTLNPQLRLVQDPQGRDVGYLFSFEDEGVLILKTTAVTPEARRRGLPAALIFQAIQEAFSRGVRHAAMALYREEGDTPSLESDHSAGDLGTWTRRYALWTRNLE